MAPPTNSSPLLAQLLINDLELEKFPKRNELSFDRDAKFARDFSPHPLCRLKTRLQETSMDCTLCAFVIRKPL